MKDALEFEVTDAFSEDHVVFLYGVTSNGKTVIARDESMPLYFLASLNEGADADSLILQINSLTAKEGSTECSVIKSVLVEKKLLGDNRKFLQIMVNNEKALKIIGHLVKTIEGIDKTFERDVNHFKKYLFDKKIIPLTKVKAAGKMLTPPPNVDYYLSVEAIESVESSKVNYNVLCFDIETYNPLGVSDPLKDPAVMISYASSTGREGVLTWKPTSIKKALVLRDEKSMIAEFVKLVHEINPSFIISYNGDNFDFPYLKERAKRNSLKLNLGWDGSQVSFTAMGARGSSAGINGLVHLDLYPFISTSMGTYLKTDTYTLNAVCSELLGETKEDFDIIKLAGLWDKGRIDDIVTYCLRDSQVTLKLAAKVLPLLFELTRIVGVTPFYVCRTGFSKLVENYLMRETRNFNEVILRKPVKEDLALRFRQTFKGGFVYEPIPGFYENIAVFDFRSLYPSIIVAHNVCPTTLDAKGKDVHVSPKIMVNGEEKSFRFAKKPRGFIPSLIKDLIERRENIKLIIKKMNKNDADYNILSARQNAIKILANAMYGYLGFPQARWYSNECAASITAWGRQYINNVLKSAESSNLKVLYGDTDSCFFTLPTPDVKQALAFADKVNRNLPEMMELKFEGFFKTGIFVSKKSEKKGAKKKYALYSENDELQVKGFELVRRDWSNIAKNIQNQVLKDVLISKDKDAALKHVTRLISNIKKGKQPITDFVIRTRMTKDVKNYENFGPHVTAAMRAEKSGKTIVSGMMINYIIVKGPGRISDKAYTEEEAVEKGLTPDYDYYINHQIIPSVEEILKVMGFSEEDILKKEQQTLQGFM